MPQSQVQCRTKRSPLNQSLARKITNFPSKKNMPPIRLRDQFGFRPHLDLHHDSLLLHRISELPTSNWSLSDNPAGLAPSLWEHPCCSSLDHELAWPVESHIVSISLDLGGKKYVWTLVSPFRRHSSQAMIS